MATKTIIITGLPRSGTTFLFNAVKTILRTVGNTTSQTNKAEEKGGSEIHLILLKPFNRDLAHNSDAIFTTVRDIPEIKRSYFNFTGEPLTEEKFKEYKMATMKYQLHDKHYHEVNYNNFRNKYGLNNWNNISEIYLKLKEKFPENFKRQVPAKEIQQKLAAIRPPLNGVEFDKENYLHYNHITTK